MNSIVTHSATLFKRNSKTLVALSGQLFSSITPVAFAVFAVTTNNKGVTDPLIYSSALAAPLATISRLGTDTYIITKCRSRSLERTRAFLGRYVLIHIFLFFLIAPVLISILFVYKSSDLFLLFSILLFFVCSSVISNCLIGVGSNFLGLAVRPSLFYLMLILLVSVGAQPDLIGITLLAVAITATPVILRLLKIAVPQRVDRRFLSVYLGRTRRTILFALAQSVWLNIFVISSANASQLNIDILNLYQRVMNLFAALSRVLFVIYPNIVSSSASIVSSAFGTLILACANFYDLPIEIGLLCFSFVLGMYYLFRNKNIERGRYSVSATELLLLSAMFVWLGFSWVFLISASAAIIFFSAYRSAYDIHRKRRL